MEVYNKNRDKNNSMHDEIREQNAKLKDAPLKDKLAYFKDYYLIITLVIVAVVISAVCLAHTILTAPSDTAFAAFFFNSAGNSSDTELIDGFVKYRDIDTKEHEAYIDASMNFSANEGDYDAYISMEKTMAVMSTGELDVIVSDAAVIDYFAKSESFHDVTTILPDDLLAQFEDKLYYAESGENGERIPVGVYVTDSPRLNQYDYYVDKKPILGFIINSNSLDNAIEFLRYIYMEDLADED